MSGVVCCWELREGGSLGACAAPAVQLRADRVGHAWIAACASHAADAPPADLRPPGEWLLPNEDP